MRMGRAAIVVSLALSSCVAPLTAHAQQPAGPPPQIQATQTFLMTWSGQKWDELKAVTADAVLVRVGPGTYTLQPAAHKSDVQLTLPFRGLSTVRTDGKITGVKVDEMAFKIGDKEMRGPGMVNLKEDNGAFRVTGVSAGTPQ